MTAAIQVLSFASSVALATVLGASSETDAYYLALAIPVLVSGVMLVAIRLGAIPALTDLDRTSPVSFSKGCSELVVAVAIGSTMLAAAVTGLAVAILPALAGDASGETVSLAQRVVVELAPLAVLGSVSGVLGAILTVRGRYLAPIAVIGFEPVAKIVFILAVGESLGAHALALGNIVGGALAVVTLFAFLPRVGVAIQWADPRRSQLLATVAKLSVPLLIAQAVLQVNPIVDRVMAAPLDTGSVTVLELGFRLFSVPTALIAGTLIAPVTATWAARFASGGWPEVRASLRRALELAVVVLPLLVGLGVLLRLEVVTLLYRGGEYGAETVAQTADVFAFFVAGLPAQVLIVALASVFIAHKDVLLPMFIALANVLLNVGLNLVLRAELGLEGIALSSTITMSVLTVAYVVAVHRSYGAIGLRRLKKPIIRAASASVAALGAGALVAAQFAAPDGRLEAAAALGASSAVAIAVYVATMFGLGQRRLLSTDAGSAAS